MTHYFETPATAGPAYEIPMTLWGHDVRLLSSPGVFSAHHLDPGTAVLLRTCTPPEGPSHVLDLGCGIGVIAVALGLGAPDARITAIDVNDQALALTRANVARLGLGPRVTACRPQDVDPGATFDEIWSNPPIRIGKPALHELLTTWLARLAPTGQAHFVVARNLGADSLGAWLQTVGHTVERLRSARGYRVLRVTH